MSSNRVVRVGKLHTGALHCRLVAPIIFSPKALGALQRSEVSMLRT